MSDQPVYRQIADIIRDRIASGELPVGEPTPSVKTLSLEFGCARQTMIKALYLLIREHLLQPVHGIGYYVIGRP